MNQEARKEYAALTIRQSRRIEGKYVRQIFRALQGQVEAFITDMEASGIERARSSLYLQISTEGLEKILIDLHVEAGLFFGRKAYREIQRSAKRVEKAGFGFNQEWIQAIIAYFQQDMFALVGNITNTTRNNILEVLEQALNEGQGIDWIASRLREPGINLYRARVIARTELGKGAFAGRAQAVETSEWETTTEWISADDARVRNSHRQVDGEVIDTGSRFQVPRRKGGVDMMLGPGDPSASAENLIQCRCSSAMRAKRDENGRLIPKRNITVIQPGQFVIPRQTILI